jgi:hypothetical protein
MRTEREQLVRFHGDEDSKTALVLAVARSALVSRVKMFGLS